MSACIDISHWQGFPDFRQVYDDGVVACIMKATEGTSYIDPNRAINSSPPPRRGSRAAPITGSSRDAPASRWNSTCRWSIRSPASAW